MLTHVSSSKTPTPVERRMSAGRTEPTSFDLLADGDAVSGSATVTQTRWGMKPFSALFGTLKVLHEIIPAATGHVVTITPKTMCAVRKQHQVEVFIGFLQRFNHQ